jgi:hypothetical protein
MPLVFAGIFTNGLSGAVTLLIGSSGLIGGGAHYAAVLARKTEQEIERATAFGFFLGFGLGVLALLIDTTT